MKTFLLFWMVLMTVSCQMNDKQRTVKLINVFPEPLCEEDFLMASPCRMVLFDSIIGIQDNKMDTLIHLVDVKNRQYMGKQCVHGQGPDEFTMIMSMEADKHGGCLLYEPNLCKLYRLSRTDSDWDLKQVFQSRKEEASFHWCVYPLTDSTYLTTGLYMDGRFCLLNRDGEVIKNFGEYPYRDEEERKRSGIIKSQVYQGSITIDPSGTRFMSCMYSGDLLEFYRITADSIYRTKKIYNHFPEYRFNESQVVVSRKSPTDYLGAVSTSKYIYLLYSGRTYEEFADRSFYGNRILVYDWEGNKIAELRSNKDLCALCLSSDSSMMYVLALDPNPVLAYFHLFDNYE